MSAQAPERPRMRLVGSKRFLKNSLWGFATVELTNGLTIADIPVLIGKNGPWASLPSKPQIGRDGMHKRGANGKPLYVAILSWRDRELSNRFSEAVVELIRAAHPDAFGEDTGP